MEPHSLIHLTPAPEILPIPTTMPVAGAMRWDSDFDPDRDPLAVEVFLTQPAITQICVHTASDLENEIGGVLIGRWCRDEATGVRFVVAENVIPACYTRQGPNTLTFTHDSQVHFHTTIEEYYPGRCIVGWYHTHPRMHVFMSQYDTWLHSGFFPELWQVALVVEPHSSTAGFFIRQMNGFLDPMCYSGFYELNGGLGHSLVRWKNMCRVNEERE